MTMLLQTLPSRRHSRRRARVVRARVLFVCIALLLSAYLAWPPSAARTGTQITTPAAVAPIDAEPEQSVDTEGALSGGRRDSDAALYVAER